MLHFFDYNPALIFIWLTIFWISSGIHEYGHAMMGKYLGDDTPEIQGRTTLNPISHIDLLGSLMILLGPFGWAKPVQTNPNNFTKTNREIGVMLVALTGPMMNVLLALLLWLPYRMDNYIDFTDSFFNVNYPENIVDQIVMMAVFLNIYLFGFNMIPIPPLDGARILRYFTRNQYNFWNAFEKNGPMILLMLIIFGAFLGINVLSFFVDIISIPVKVLVFGL